MYDVDAYYEDQHVLPEHDDPENNGETQGPEYGDDVSEFDGEADPEPEAPDGDTSYGDNSLDDGEALASAGFGTDEDYGYYGGEEED